jgi:hypothetical protein
MRRVDDCGARSHPISLAIPSDGWSPTRRQRLGRTLNNPFLDDRAHSHLRNFAKPEMTILLKTESIGFDTPLFSSYLSDFFMFFNL